MKGHPTSFRDPAYDALDAQVTEALGLPEGLLTAIRTKGERTNADKVSSAGARTVYQIIPATRKALQQRYGFDPYASAENAAQAAGQLLKDSLDRNGGDVGEAVAEYHGGTDRRRRGPVNRAYVARVTGVEPDPAVGKAAVAPQRVVDAYNSGEMTAEQRASFDKALKAGQLRLPAGAALTQAPAAADASVAVVPQRVIDNYNNRSDMTDAQRDLLDRDIKGGNLRLPPGAKLTRPGPRTNAEALGLGVRDALEAIPGLVDIPAGAVNSAINIPFVLAGQKAPLSQTPVTDLVASGLNRTGLPRAETPGEQLTSAIRKGAIQGVATAGLATPLVGATGATGTVARAVSSAPVIDTLAGGAGAAASEATRQAGGGPLAQLGAGLVAGGGVGVGGAAAASRIRPRTARIVETTPREVLIDQTGQLTDEGREIAARAGVEPEELRGAYETAAQEQVAGTQTVRRHEGQDYPVEVLGERADIDGTPHVRVRAQDGAEGFVPVDEVLTVERSPEAAATQAPEGAPAGRPAQLETAASQAEPPLQGGAAARMAQAQSEGVSLTRGQATKDFDVQSAEGDVAGTQTAEGRAVRDFQSQQTQQIKDAVIRFREALGDTSLGATERGEAVKVGLRDLMDRGKQGVTEAYRRVRDLAGDLGDNAKGLTALKVDDLRGGVREILADDTVSDATRRGLSQIAAKYGLIGEQPRHVPDTGMTTVMVRDADNNLVRGPSFAGQVEPLDLTNAERFRQRLNDLYDKMASRNPQEALKPVLDDAVTDAAERAAKEGFGDVGAAAKEARELFKQQKATFEAKDVVNQIAAWKKGAPGTEAVNPESIWSLVYGSGPQALTNIRKLKGVLLSGSTEKSRAAWRAIQAQAVGDLFDRALVRNAEGGEGAISGAKLNTAINKFGQDKLKIILEPDQFGQLMKLRRIIADATIPLPRVANPSGSGHLIARMMGTMAKGSIGAARFVPGAGAVFDAAAGLVKTGIERARSERVAEGATSFTPEQAAAADAKAPTAQASDPTDAAQVVRQFIDATSGNRLLAPILTSTTATQQDGDQ